MINYKHCMTIECYGYLMISYSHSIRSSQINSTA